MNNKRRKKINEVNATIKNCISRLESVRDDEDEARDNIPENLQNSDSYSESEECSDKIEEAISDLLDVVEALDNI